MIGREVESKWHRVRGTVERWEPLGAGLCDALVAEPSGRRVWVSSRDVKPVDGRGPLPSREDARARADAEALESLRKIRDQLIAECAPAAPRWPGCDFGKVLLGRGVIAALDEVSERVMRRALR